VSLIVVNARTPPFVPDPNDEMQIGFVGLKQAKEKQ